MIFQNRPKTTINLNPENWDAIATPETQEQLRKTTDLQSLPTSERDRVIAALAKSEILITGWGSAPLSQSDLESCVDLRLIIHAAGTLRGGFPDLSFPPQVRICSAVHLNARPVAEYTLGLILSSLRGAFTWRDKLRQNGTGDWWRRCQEQANGYEGRCIAIVGFGMIAKRLLTLLKPFGFEILVVSEFTTPADESALGFTTASLEAAAARADVLTLHEADLPQFRHMVDSKILTLLPNGATLINTARGGLIDDHALCEALVNRPLLALLDVIVNADKGIGDNPLLALPNCFITPHVAGSLKGEVKRFGRFVYDEIENYLSNRPLAGEIDLRTIALRA